MKINEKAITIDEIVIAIYEIRIKVQGTQTEPYEKPIEINEIDEKTIDLKIQQRPLGARSNRN